MKRFSYAFKDNNAFEVYQITLKGILNYFNKSSSDFQISLNVSSWHNKWTISDFIESSLVHVSRLFWNSIKKWQIALTHLKAAQHYWSHYKVECRTL